MLFFEQFWGVGDDDFCKETHPRKQQKLNDNDRFLFVCQTFHFFQEKDAAMYKKKKSETQTQLGENEKQEKKAMQQEREPNKEPIKKGEGKHCADQAVSLLKKKNKKHNQEKGN